MYIVKWPDNTYNLVYASSAEQLFETLDELGDPMECCWKEVDMSLPLMFAVDTKTYIFEDDGDEYKTYELSSIGQEWSVHGQDFITQHKLTSRFKLRRNRIVGFTPKAKPLRKRKPTPTTKF